MGDNVKNRIGKYFIRVSLFSGSISNPLGSEELMIFCQSSNDNPSFGDVDEKRLVKWVNSNPDCKKNQSNEGFKVSRQDDAFTVIYLKEKEIISCNNANRIYPRLAANE